MRRQDLARHPDFEPMRLFQHLDVDNTGKISPKEIFEFMSKQFLNPHISDAVDIIREYDGSQDVELDFDEFCQLVLPSTNPNLRHMASTRRFSPYFRPTSPIPYEVLSLFSRLLDKEMGLHRTRNDSKRQLAACQDFVKVRAFESITRGYRVITMPDLISYLEKNSFFPRREDIEAILRRCDHDGNRELAYDEFLELVVQNEEGTEKKQAKPADEHNHGAGEHNRGSGEHNHRADETHEEVANSGERLDGTFNDRVEDLDETDELRQGPKEASAEKSGSAKRRPRQPANDNLTPAQR